MKQPTVTIGIPAYNEALGIGSLLADLSNQDPSGYKLDHIYVVSDASTDNTAHIAGGFRHPALRVIIRETRGGKAAVMNQICELSKSDILVILDADTRLPDPLFIKKLISPIVTESADLTAADEQVSKPTTWFEKILTVSVAIKRDVFFHYKNGQNFYTCHGQARAFSKKLYQKFAFPFSAGEDLYSYIFCLSQGLKYKFAPNAVVHFRLPTSYSDHERQSIRFAQAITKIKTEFGTSTVDELTRIPWASVVYWTLRRALRSPLSVAVNIFVFGFARVRSIIVNGSQNTWTMVTSSKKVS